MSYRNCVAKISEARRIVRWMIFNFNYLGRVKPGWDARQVLHLRPRAGRNAVVSWRRLRGISDHQRPVHPSGAAHSTLTLLTLTSRGGTWRRPCRSPPGTTSPPRNSPGTSRHRLGRLGFARGLRTSLPLQSADSLSSRVFDVGVR